MAGTAEEALARLDRDPLDIMVIDIGLPGMDGLALSAHVAARSPDVALLIVTGVANFQAALAAMQAGAVDYLVKPFAAASLMRAYHRAVERRRVRLDAGSARGLYQSLAERTLGIRLLLEKHRESAPALVATYLDALRSRNPEACAHSERVGAVADAIGRELALAPRDQEHVVRVALVHDIGKLTLPDALLFYKADLSPEDLAVVRRYPEFGSDILRQIPALAACAHPVFAQLEHFDGSGTPLGIRGVQIPLAARVVAVANVCDVMIHSRPYAPLQTPLEAMQEIHACAGAQFDPLVVDALSSAVERDPQLLSEAGPRLDQPKVAPTS